MRWITRRELLLTVTVAACGCRAETGPAVVTLAVEGFV